MIFDPIILQRYRLIYLKLRAVCGSSRFLILNIIKNQSEVNVSKLIEITHMDQPIVSQNLAVLKKADLLVVVAKKKERFYSVDDSELSQLISFCHRLKKKETGKELEVRNSYSLLNEAYKYFKLLLHPGRMALVEILDRQECSSVNDLVNISRQSQSITSQNLKILQNLGFVIKKVDGRRSIYSLDREYIGFLSNLMAK